MRTTSLTIDEPRTISIGYDVTARDVFLEATGAEYHDGVEFLGTYASTVPRVGGDRAPMGPAELVALARRRHRARQTHPGKRGRS